MRKIKSAAALLLAAALCVGVFAVSAAANSAPEAQNLEFETCRGVSFGGQLSAVDPDGDTLTYSIITQPVKGSVDLQKDGKFVYTPDSGRKGKDYFGYKASDNQGNISQEGTVIIKIGRKAAVTYSDMSGSPDYLNAVMLAQNGIFTGAKVGETYLFEPDRQVSRGEFLSMCMELSGVKALEGVVSTGFTDDADIPSWEKASVSTALMNGYVQGYTENGLAVFGSQRTITMAEASVMLNKTAGFADVACPENGTAPTWAAQSVANLSSVSVISDGDQLSDQLTRAQAAEMLVSALTAMKNK